MSARLSFFITLALICCVTYARSQVVGGLNEERPVDNDVRHVLKSVHGDIEKMAHSEFKSLEPISYRKQVVAGFNYFIKMAATEENGKRSVIHARVYKPLRGPNQLAAIRTNLDHSKTLEYFE